MSLLRRSWLTLVLLLAIFVGVGTAVAQSESDDELSLRLSRDFGTGLGSNIQGTFSFRISGPDNLARVTFYIDDQIVGEDSEAPFRLQFKTDDHSVGVHTLRAVGVTQDGQELTSNSLSRNFISGSAANRIIFYIVIPIVLLVIGGRLLSSWIVNRGRNASGEPVLNVNGAFGGAICPKCSKPFAMHIWGLNIVIGKFDRCPHCGKWSVVRRVPQDALNTAVEATQQAEAAKSESQATDHSDDETSWRKRLDDSKFDS